MIELKLNDPDRYMLSLYIQNGKDRLAIQWLDYFNLELSRMRDTITTPHMGYIRLQWWHDEITKVYAGEIFSNNPVLVELSEIIQRSEISCQDIEKIIASRSLDYEGEGAIDIYDYAVRIHTPVMSVKAKILGEQEDIDCISESYALVGLVRAVAFYESRSQKFIQGQQIKEIYFEAMRLLSLDKANHKYFKAHHALVKLYLNQIADYNFQSENSQPIPFKDLRVWWGSF